MNPNLKPALSPTGNEDVVYTQIKKKKMKLLIVGCGMYRRCHRRRITIIFLQQINYSNLAFDPATRWLCVLFFLWSPVFAEVSAFCYEYI